MAWGNVILLWRSGVRGFTDLQRKVEVCCWCRGAGLVRCYNFFLSVFQRFPCQTFKRLSLLIYFLLLLARYLYVKEATVECNLKEYLIIIEVPIFFPNYRESSGYCLKIEAGKIVFSSIKH